MEPVLYLSIPTSIDMTKIFEFQQHTSSLPVSFDYWLRGSTYSDYPVRESDGVVFFLPDNNFGAVIDDLPNGLRKELKIAIDHKLPIYIAYKRYSDGKWKIYNADLKKQGTAIEGNGTDGPVQKFPYYDRTFNSPTKQVEQPTELENQVQKLKDQTEMFDPRTILLLRA